MAGKQIQVLAAISDTFAHRRDLSQKDVAAKAGISASYLSRILSGHHCSLSIDLLDDLCQACGLDLCDAIKLGQRLLIDVPPPTYNRKLGGKKSKMNEGTIELLFETMKNLQWEIESLKKSKTDEISLDYSLNLDLDKDLDFDE